MSDYDEWDQVRALLDRATALRMEDIYRANRLFQAFDDSHDSEMCESIANAVMGAFLQETAAGVTPPAELASKASAIINHETGN